MADRGATQPTQDDPLPGATELAAALASNAPAPGSQSLHIGRYQLKDPPIGRGGMGVVFEAVHDELRHTVALKLMNARAASPEAQERFIREARVLANCHHPGIAQVYDAGTHRQGDQDIPYYVMEFVRGARTITRYAADKQLSIDQRLELFARVCDAMQSAHDLNIVHRDLKPDNILVDAAGQPKIIDFGVARALNADLPLPAAQTGGDTLLGTLQYMSPEQTGSEAGHIDRRSDVYALGVVLYELLCGRLPYDVSKATGLDTAIRTIREAPPAPPRQVNPALDDDIETILLKALHKDPDRRYPSAAAMASSIRDRLAGRPIADRRDSSTYLLKKRARALIGAHRISTWLMVTVASVVIAMLLAGALRRWTPLAYMFERVATTSLRPSGHAPLRNVRMIAMQDGTDFAALARAEGIEGVDPDDLVTLRLLHGHLMEKLADSGARVVAWDIFFSRSRGSGASPDGSPHHCPFEEELLRGIRALKSAGCEVVMTAGQAWDIGEDDLPASLCPRIAHETKWGFITAQLQREAPWSLELIFVPLDRHAMPALALATCGAYWRPNRYHWVFVDLDRRTLEKHARLQYVHPSAERPRRWGAPAEASADRVRLSFWKALDEDVPHQGKRSGDWMGYYFLQIPSHRIIQDAIVDYGEALRASPQQLRHWFDGRVIVIGDARAGRDGPFPTPDGRSYSGFVAHALGIDAILSGHSILHPTRISFAGLNVETTAVFAALATLSGALLGVALPRPRWGRRALMAVLVLLVIVASLTIYYHSRVLLDPLAGMIGVVLAAEAVGSMTRAGRMSL